jgi:thiosulfate/3-mercaptopyruvate sulfurtransferase
MRKAVFVFCLLLTVFASVDKALTVPAFSYASKIETDLLQRGVIVDVRPQELCLKGSLSGARCLPAGDFFGPHGRLVNFPDLSWLLGTAGLSGSEHVLVVGISPLKRDFVAGILYLAGQQKVTILRISFAELKAKSADLKPGQKRANIRSAVHSAPFRAEMIILRNELDALLKNNKLPDLLDGRSEKEYWGENIRTSRGGHLPGAQLLPAAELRALLKIYPQRIPDFSVPIVYAHNTLESVAYFSLLRAGFGIEARVFLTGWADWAMESSLSVDSLSYPDKQSLNKIYAPEIPAQIDNYWLISIAVILAGLLLMAWVILSKKGKHT